MPYVVSDVVGVLKCASTPPLSPFFCSLEIELESCMATQSVFVPLCFGQSRCPPLSVRL